MRVDWKDMGALAVESVKMLAQGVVQLALFAVAVPFCLALKGLSIVLWGGGSRNP